MKKIIIGLLSILLIVIGIYSIIKIMHIDIIEDDEEVINYVLFNEGTNYKSYSFNGINLKREMIDIEDKTLYFKDNVLYVGIKEIGKVRDVFSNFAIYDNRILVMFFRDADFKYNILEYDYYANDYRLISNIDGYNVDLDDGCYFEDAGYTVNLSLVRDDKIYYAGKEIDVCNYKDQSLVISKGMEMLYDSESRTFPNQEEFNTVNVALFKELYDSCNQ